MPPAGSELSGSDRTDYETLVRAPYEEEEVEAVRRRPRSTGWRVIVPRDAAQAISIDDAQGAVQLKTTNAGVLLSSAAADPFAMSDAEREAMERALLPSFARVCPPP